MQTISTNAPLVEKRAAYFISTGVRRRVPDIEWRPGPSIHGKAVGATTIVNRVTGAREAAVSLRGVTSAVIDYVLDITAVCKKG